MINIKNAVFAGITGATIGLGSLGFAATASAAPADCGISVQTGSSVVCSDLAKPGKRAKGTTIGLGSQGKKSRIAELDDFFNRAKSPLEKIWEARGGLI